MTRNCLNVMRKIAASTKAAPYRIAEPMPQGGAVRQFFDLASRPGSTPISPEKRNFMKSPFNTDVWGIKAAESLGIPTGMTPVERSYHLAAPTNDELYQAQKQIDARRAQSGLPRVNNRYNKPFAQFLYSPEGRGAINSLALRQQLDRNSEHHTRYMDALLAYDKQ